MKRLIILLLLIPVAVAQVPTDVDTTILQRITQEHQATRQFLSTELTRQRTTFFNEWDARANYYEDYFNKTLHDLVVKLGLVWGGIILTVIGINNLLSRKLEKRRFAKMKESIKDEIMTDILQDKMKADEVEAEKQRLEQMKPELMKAQLQMEENSKKINDLLAKLRAAQ